ncbi:hypothetical protein JY651_33120 [Pyxidicoccus parkwayensis]|jgi:hypothetical protein|uniref:Lipoprotein n=1 Tax=Pyxidicoccus parkwayensis TaxID=2813578 RepID=A0ABX7NRF6_9BACT|nr:hypothetical protein [Pyxidicoccus parkwaysis]QSQ20092.1 hypothetical protein JY651_33120 [Pyxidicoccus parkwaysis]
MFRLPGTLLMALMVGSAGCGSATVSSSGKPASAKWVGPTMPGPGGGTVRTVIYYGPWQCNARYMSQCERRCASEGHALLGCIWLADLKGDWQGRFAFLPAEAGGYLAFKHCCCDYSTVSDVQSRRRTWNNAREGFRNQWGRELGAWPQTDGNNWPGHHIFDLLHGGDPTARGNVLPVPPEVHEVINLAYPACYTRGGEWSVVGPDRPYVESP